MTSTERPSVPAGSRLLWMGELCVFNLRADLLTAVRGERKLAETLTIQPANRLERLHGQYSGESGDESALKTKWSPQHQ